MSNNEIKVVVYNSEDVSGTLPPNPKDFLSWWEEKFDKIPEVFKEKAVVDINVEEYSGDCSLAVEVYYWRKKTPQEIRAERLSRDRSEKARLRNLEICEREELARLKAKYES